MARAQTIALDKTAGAVTDVNGNGAEDVGDTITYTFVVRNTGTVTLTQVLLSDAQLALVNAPCSGLGVLRRDDAISAPSRAAKAAPARPAPASSWTRWRPMNPFAPVTQTVIAQAL